MVLAAEKLVAMLGLFTEQHHKMQEVDNMVELEEQMVTEQQGLTYEVEMQVAIIAMVVALKTFMAK